MFGVNFITKILKFDDDFPPLFSMTKSRKNYRNFHIFLFFEIPTLLDARASLIFNVFIKTYLKIKQLSIFQLNKKPILCCMRLLNILVK